MSIKSRNDAMDYAVRHGYKQRMEGQDTCPYKASNMVAMWNKGWQAADRKIRKEETMMKTVSVKKRSQYFAELQTEPTVFEDVVNVYERLDCEDHGKLCITQRSYDGLKTTTHIKLQDVLWYNVQEWAG